MQALRNTDSGAIREGAIPLTGGARDYDELVERIGEAHFVLLGEASHGTHEFYRERAQITMRLIREEGFSAIAVEADWPDAYLVNRYVRGVGPANDAASALRAFLRFPGWMWRNTEVLEFITWLRAYNDSLETGAPRTGFYGLDLYSMYASMRAVIDYLEKVDPDAARRARYRYACFEHFEKDAQAYGYQAGFGVTESCEQEVAGQLVELQRRASDLAHRDGRIPHDEFFFAEQNARLVKNAEGYYRAMFGGRTSSWNLRDRHMTETLDQLVEHLGRQQGGPVRAVVWAHNSHLGDARATEMGRRGEWNVGQLVRERHGAECVNVGFSTHHGTVTAASEWDGPAERKRVRKALPESYEAVLHHAGLPSYLLVLNPVEEHTASLAEGRLERAIGVIYRPETERSSHYFRAWLPRQFDAVIHIDETRALEPLERTSGWDTGEPPETYPSGI
jgi:erythromycin esterase-like protein